MKVTEEQVILRNQIGENEAFKELVRKVDDLKEWDLFGMVLEFNKKFEVPSTEQSDYQLPFANQNLRLAQLHEEVAEYEEAVKQGNMAQALDSLVDLTYFALGTAIAHKFPFNEAFSRVHEANMLKTRAQRNSDSKRGSRYDVVKPEGWKPPVFDDLIPGAAGDAP